MSTIKKLDPTVRTAQSNRRAISAELHKLASVKSDPYYAAAAVKYDQVRLLPDAVGPVKDKLCNAIATAVLTRGRGL